MQAALDLPTLVLNRGWIPVHVTAVRHALALVFTERAAVVCPETCAPFGFGEWIARGVPGGAPRIRGVRFEIAAPEVVVLRGYDKMPPRGVVFNRRNLTRRDENVCQYCGKRLAPERLTIDHIVPLSRGGDTDWDNCVLACHRCNGRKADLTPREARMKLLKLPAHPRWSPRYAIYARENRPRAWDQFLPSSKHA
jgi:5-methylcytosine-specific restriction endonuclease McrA